MNQLKKKIVYYYLVITAILLITEWYLYQFIYKYSSIWSKKTGIPEIVFTISGVILVAFLFCVVSYVYYGKVNKMILKETERQIKERNMLFANLAHDLKNPMASVLGFARALEKNAVSEEERENIYYLIAEKSNQMNDMILKMFQYAKMESDGYSLKFVETDLCALMRNIVADRYMELEEHQIKVDIDIPDEKIMVNVDVSEFSRAINNLISNAIKHNNDGIRVLISVKHAPHNLTKVMIADSGDEIPVDIRECIFEPFRCSDTSRVTKDGSGLGLAITKRIVGLHDGKIYIDDGIEEYTKAFVIELNTL